MLLKVGKLANILEFLFVETSIFQKLSGSVMVLVNK
jgi:hypothetical protein